MKKRISASIDEELIEKVNEYAKVNGNTSFSLALNNIICKFNEISIKQPNESKS